MFLLALETAASLDLATTIIMAGGRGAHFLRTICTNLTNSPRLPYKHKPNRVAVAREGVDSGMEARQARPREEVEAPPPFKLAGPSKKKGGGAANKAKRTGPKPPSGGAQGSFHYLNVQKRLLRDYAKKDLELGARWRATLLGVVSSRGIDLGVTPSSQWTQEELERLYVYWGLARPEPEELRARTCLKALFEGGDAGGLPNDGQQSRPPRAKKQKSMEATMAAAREESDEDVDDETTTLTSSASSVASWPPHGQTDGLVFSSGSLFEVHETHHCVHESDAETTTTNFSEDGPLQGLYQGMYLERVAGHTYLHSLHTYICPHIHTLTHILYK